MGGSSGEVAVNGEGIGTVDEELFEGFVEDGVAVVGDDFAEGLEDEPTVLKEWVGNLQVVGGYLCIVI